MHEPIDPFEDVVECGGQLYFAVGFTSGGFPFGPRVEIVDGKLVFLDEPGGTFDPTAEPEDRDLSPWDPRDSDPRDCPF